MVHGRVERLRVRRAERGAGLGVRGPEPGTIEPLPDYMVAGRAYDIALNGYYLYVAGAYGGPSVVHLEPPGEALHVETLAGSNRYTTAIESSRRAFPGGAGTVVIATGENWPDALGGSALAGVVGGPILLTPAAALRGDVLDEIRSLEATRAIILGGPKAVGPAVETALNAELGSDNVDRIAGSNRYETAELIAQAVFDEGMHSDIAFFATGLDYPDAAAAAPVAAANGWPILLVRPRAACVHRSEDGRHRHWIRSHPGR